MKIHVDPQRCQGHNRCYSLAPDLFSVDDYGYATALNDGAVSPEAESRARLAVNNCPELAIDVVDG